MATDCSIPQERRTNIAIKTSNKLNTLLATFANSKAQEICQDGAGIKYGYAASKLLEGVH